MLDSDALAARIQDRMGLRPPVDRVQRNQPPHVPDHELSVRIGGGSYGDVWLVRSVTGRLRAAKVVWRQNFSSDRPYEREFRGIVQFEPISRGHPGVVNILHVGRDDAAGCFFYVMELADDLKAGPETSRVPSVWSEYAPRTLAADLKERGRLPVSSVLALGAQLADALGHIHRHGLVHRDVKPSNVIFVDGQAKLADIGLIAGVDEARSFVGTEGFIPPEGPGTMQADLFGLGRLLYEAATGKDRCEFPDLPTDLELWPDRAAMLELNEILARACAPNPKQRHANAAELAGDLNLLLSGRSIRRAYGIEQRLRRVTRFAVAAGITSLLAAGGVWFQRNQRERADLRAQSEAHLRARAERAEHSGREQLRESLLQQARAFTSSSEPDGRARALAALSQAAALRPGLDLRNAAIAALATPELRVIRRWNPRRDGSSNERPDAQLERYSRRNADGTISIHSMADDLELDRLPAVDQPAQYGVFSPDGLWMAVKYYDGSLRVWNLSSRTNQLTIEDARGFGFGPGGGIFAAGNSGNLLLGYDLESGREAWRQTLASPGNWVAFHPSEPILVASAAGRTQLEIRRVSDGTLERTIDLPEMGLIARWSAEGGSLITTHRDFSMRIWDWPNAGSPRLIFRLHRAEPALVSTDSTGRWLVSAGWDNQSAVVDLRDGRTLFNQQGTLIQASTIRSEFLMANDADWRLVKFEPTFALETIPIHDEHKSPRDLAFSPDGRWIATGGQDGVRLFDRHSHEVHRLMTNEMSHRLSFGRQSDRLHCVTPDRLRMWRLEVDPITTRARVEMLPLVDDGRRNFNSVDIDLIGLTPDGERWLSAVPDSAAGKWMWVRGRFDSIAIESLGAVTPNSARPEFSADGRWLAWGNWRGSDAHVLALGTANPAVRLPAEGTASVAFSPDNRLLMIGGATELRFHEQGSWRVLQTIPRQPSGQLPPHFAFTADSLVCAVVLSPNRVLLLDTISGNELATLPAGSRFPVKSAFSPDQKQLAAVSTDHSLLIWDLERLRGRLSELGLDW